MELKKRKNFIYEINENSKRINRENPNKNKNLKNTKKNISITTNNSKEKDNKFINLNIRLTENKNRIKNNLGEIKNLINFIKSRENNSQRNKIQRQYTANEKHFVKNGLNHIYTKTFVKNNHKNKNQNNIRILNSNNLNPNKKSLQTSGSMNDIKKKKIYLNEINIYSNKKPNIQVNRVNSTKNIYIPKKVSLSQKNIYEIKRNDESPIYHKKRMKNNNINEYYFNSEKRNKIEKDDEDDNYIKKDNNLRMTYSKKNYSKSNPNFFSNKGLKSETFKSPTQNLNIPYLKHFFEKDIEELSSIHNESSFELCTFDNDEYKSNKLNRNSVYIRKTKTNKLNFKNINSDNKTNRKKIPDISTNNKINLAFSYQKNKLNNNKKKNLRYSNSAGEFTNTYLDGNDSKEKEIKTNSNKLKMNTKGIINSVNFIQKKEQKQKMIIQNNKIAQSYKKEERNNLLNRIYKKEIMSFHLDDFVVYEERLKNIISRLNDNKIIFYDCYDFLNYFRNNCDIFKNLNLLIKNEYDLKTIQNGINYILISIIFTFDYSYKKGLLNNILLYMKEMLNFTYQNLILIYDYLLKITLLSEIDSIILQKLSNLINNELEKSEKDNNINLDYVLSTDNNNFREKKNRIETIKNNTNFILQTIKIIIKNFKNKNSSIFLFFLKEIYLKASFKEIFYFFVNKILYSNELFTYLSPNIILRQNPNIFKDITIPYIKNISRKKYTLILGLEGTLINYKFSNKFSAFNGILEIRPGLYQFLSEMKKYFEIIIFSLFTQKIADYIINNIEKKEKYFDYRLYLQHSIIIENEFVKELKRIGRPIDKIIIVDNFSQNYKLNKKNAINIKSFWGKDYNDNTLKDLGKILIKIIKDSDDVRNGIDKYRNDIIGKVTSIMDI